MYEIEIVVRICFKNLNWLVSRSALFVRGASEANRQDVQGLCCLQLPDDVLYNDNPNIVFSLVRIVVVPIISTLLQ